MAENVDFNSVFEERVLSGTNNFLIIPLVFGQPDQSPGCLVDGITCRINPKELQRLDQIRTNSPSDENHEQDFLTICQRGGVGRDSCTEFKLLQKSCWLSEQLIDAQAVIAPAAVPVFGFSKSSEKGSSARSGCQRDQYRQASRHQVLHESSKHRLGTPLARSRKAGSSLHIRQIVGLLEVGWDYDPPYYVMEYLPNGSLASLLEEGPLRPAEAVHMAKQIARGLVHAHGQWNSALRSQARQYSARSDLEPRLCDFGQSRLVEEQSHALGTLFYMAPEQADLKPFPNARWMSMPWGDVLSYAGW